MIWVCVNGHDRCGSPGPDCPYCETRRRTGPERRAWDAARNKRPTERTDQGEQPVIPGAERSARQAAAAREGPTGKLQAKAPQREPGPLFEPPAPVQSRLFDDG